MKKVSRKATTIDEFLADVPAEKRAALQLLRQTIKRIVPTAEECISYGVAAFRLDGKVLVGFGAGANHCTFFPMSGTTVAAHRDDLQDFETSKGAIRFQPEKPLPFRLIKKLIQTRIAENQAGKAPAKRRALPRKTAK